MALENGIALRQALAWAGGALIIGIGVFWLSMSAIFSALPSDGCERIDRISLESPDAALRADLFLRDCGATSGFNTQVSIENAGEQNPSPTGNVLVLTQKGEGPKGDWGGPDLHMRWLGSRHLVLVRDPSSTVTFQASRVHGVTVDVVARELLDDRH